MRIAIVSPGPLAGDQGNSVTARRWADIFRKLGHEVTIQGEWRGENCDALVALHARKSASSIHEFARKARGKPLIVALTGTDLYGDLPKGNREAWRSIEEATRVVALQPRAAAVVGRGFGTKLRVIFQSAEKTRGKRGQADAFVVCVAGHLRKVKDPFRAALAVRALPEESAIVVVHYGEALEPGMAERARKEMEINPRYRWYGGLPQHVFRKKLAGSDLLVVSSRAEGGANVIAEAVADGVPVIASRIPGNKGMLGRGYPGYFRPGHTATLREKLLRAERDPVFYRKLGAGCEDAAPAFRPGVERRAWRELLREVGIT